ncbi:GLPGLI family protein [Mucilaginibacter sp. PPCGB 2223]|uniref:GLPGLI family protein n=1 Tax=Mucilaginibacter sp. PPCGB 2223 TaxID=1886027 RepID=UPI0008243F1B|nr:GLPGLI family protein [Mucilaginibacter sp. PPCGB 2223]OCX54835.1 GLPGLI family protein [Mucilaginibacter sp. PPCGB 2223]
MKQISILFLIFLTACGTMYAQNAHFSFNGVIEYQKSVNMFALMKKNINKDNESYMRPAYESYIKNQPQFKVLNSTLSFQGDKTLFTPIEPETPMNGFGISVMAEQNNTIYTDLGTNTSVAQKKVYEETFLLKDSTRRINWKMTSETRDIAGYHCRRANALIMDSIYVVAFYTDEIPVSGGPESFTGLPGMILGVALPHENITWFATKVTDMLATNQKPLVAPTKGKPIDRKGLTKTLQSALKDWGDYAQAALKAFSL